jgi:hypothetical protein
MTRPTPTANRRKGVVDHGRGVIVRELRPSAVAEHSEGWDDLKGLIAAGHSDDTVMAIGGHSSTRLLERHTHPTDTLTLAALETGRVRCPTIHKAPRNGPGGRR